MNVEVRADAGEAPFGLAHAVLVYSDGRRAFATLHDPAPAEKGGAPALGPGRMVTTTFLKTLAKQLGESVSPDVLPENVLVRTADVTVWWRAASVATLFYNPSKADPAAANALRAINGKRVPIPPLVFRATSNALWVRALKENRRPTAGTALYAAPFYNVSSLGGVCLGSMRRPHGRGLETLPQWEAAFFESEFTHVLPGVIPALYPKTADTFAAMWALLARQLVGAKPDASTRYFPTNYLHVAPKRQTLAAFVTQDQVGRL